MPIPGIDSKVDLCLQDNPSELNLAQITGVSGTTTYCSVANTSVLPSAPNNKGKWVYVEDTGSYRYSNGEEWTNSYDSTCRVAKSEIYGAGCNNVGQLGINALGNVSSPVQEITSSNWNSVQVAQQYSRAIKCDNTLWLWGCSWYGVLSQNNLTNYSSPVKEITSSSWTQIAGTGVVTLAQKQDGTVWGWGFNGAGVIGNNASSSFPNGVSSPVQEITSSTDWCFLYSSTRIATLIKTNGTLWTMGCNVYGGLGHNDTINKSSPTQEFCSATNWCNSSSLLASTAAIKTDGTLWVWGRNTQGMLSDNTVVDKSTPVQEITSSTNWSISTGADQENAHFFGIKTDGTLWVWGGNNGNGQMGVGIGVACYSSPVQEISSSTNWCSISAGLYVTSAVKTDGTLWGWGRNIEGALMLNGAVTAYSSPVQEFTSSTDWIASSSGYSTLGLKATVKGFNEP